MRSCAVFTLLFFISVCRSCSGQSPAADLVQWVRLTKDNFTADINSHPFVLCIATVPWCGESRSIMQQLVSSIKTENNLRNVVQLRVIYINFDKSLVPSHSRRTKHPILTFYWYANPFKYKGKFKVQNIIAALYHGISLMSEVPLKILATNGDLETFMKSTDKAVILFDFCNYAEKLLEHKGVRSTDTPIDSTPSCHLREAGLSSVALPQYKMLPVHGHFDQALSIETCQDLQPDIQMVTMQKLLSSSGEDVLQEGIGSKEPTKYVNKLQSKTVEALAVSDTISGSVNVHNRDVDKTSVLEDQVVSCQERPNIGSFEVPISFSAESANMGPHGVSWLGHHVKTAGAFGPVTGCNRTEYKRFVAVYRNLTKIARAHVLTPERSNFGLVRNQSLLFDLGIGRMQGYTWFLMSWMLDQPHMPKLYLGNEAVDSFLSTSKQLVLEVDHELLHHNGLLSKETLSAFLFIDRSSQSHEIRSSSWEALRAVREVAREFMGMDTFDPEDGLGVHVQAEETTIRAKSAMGMAPPTDTLSNLKILLSHASLQTTTFEVVSEEDNETPRELAVANEQGSRVVLKILAHDKDKPQVGSSLPNILSESHQDAGLEKILLSENSAIYEMQLGDIRKKLGHGFLSSSLSEMEHIFPTKSGPSVGAQGVGHVEELIQEGKGHKEKLIEKGVTHGSSVSFFFADGEDQLKDILVPGLAYPSLAVLDLSGGGYYVFPSYNRSIEYSAVIDFIEHVTRGSLPRTYRTESAPKSTRTEQVRPPFVNRDFHAVNGVPPVTTETLLHLLSAGHHQAPLTSPSESKKGTMAYSLERGSLVLYTIPSCGFCKRMELVFREVHRLLALECSDNSIWGVADPLCSNVGVGRQTQASTLFDDLPVGGSDVHGLEVKHKLPVLYQIDCTANDCSPFLQGIDQEEPYPTIKLYSRDKKDVPGIFDGRPTVQDILKFLHSEGHISTKDLQTLQRAQNSSSNRIRKMEFGCSFPIRSPQSIHIDSTSSIARHAYHFTADTKETPSMSIDGGDEDNEKLPELVVYPTVGSVLVATEQTSKASKAFESSSILIVKADAQEGFQGVIFNKPVSWKRLPGLNIEVESFLNSTALGYGGPVVVQGEPFVSLSRLKGVEGFSEVSSGVYFGGPTATMLVLQAIKDRQAEAADFWFYVGYAVWGWQQLLNEIAANAWKLTDYEEGTKDLPIRQWIDGSTISVWDLLNAWSRA